MSDIFTRAAEHEVNEEPDNEVVEGAVVLYCGDSIVLKFEGEKDITLSCDQDEGHFGGHHDRQNHDEYTWYDTITMLPVRPGDEGFKAQCTCGDTFGPEDTLIKVGRQVMEHAKKRGHIPRQHEDSE